MTTTWEQRLLRADMANVDYEYALWSPAGNFRIPSTRALSGQALPSIQHPGNTLFGSPYTGNSWSQRRSAAFNPR